MTTRIKKSPVAVFVALAGLPAMVLMVQPKSARAQQQINTQVIQNPGHLLDANNQIGSGGYNGRTAQSQINYNQLNNNVVYGNVSGLNGFQGKLNTFDARQFQGTVASSPSDTLNAQAAPVNYAQRTTGVPSYVTYYDTSRYTAPTPQNYTPVAGGNGITPAPPVDRLAPTGYIVGINQQSLDPAVGTLPLPGELTVAGPVDPGAAATLFSMNPLYGVRPIQNGNAANTGNQSNGTTDTFYQSRQYNTPMLGSPNARMTPAAIQQLRDELNKSAIPANQPGQNNNNVPTPANGANTPAGVVSEGASGTPVTGALNNGAITNTQLPPVTPLNNQLPDQAIGSQPVQAPANDLSNGQSLQSQLTLIPPSKQSKQLKLLEEKFAAQHGKLSDVEATKRLNEAEQAQKNKIGDVVTDPAFKKPMVPGGGGAAGIGGMGSAVPATKPAVDEKATDGKILLPPVPSAADRQPVIVTSLATGTEAPGLANLLKTAEERLRDGKYTEAVDTYETAQQVAPNNPFVWLGRSFAELGASYYGKSDQDLNRAIAVDPAILSGKYDLNGLIGDTRMKFVVKDLTEVADQEKSSARPLVLLSFIAHNNGDDAAAAKYLDQAAPRGGYDTLIKLMRETWDLK